MNTVIVKVVYISVVFAFGLHVIHKGLNTLKTGSLYWTAPTISGFKNRHNEKNPAWMIKLSGYFSIAIGIACILFSLWLLILSIFG
jgi:hypothetical protein